MHSGVGIAQYKIDGSAAVWTHQKSRITSFEVPLAFRLRLPIKKWAFYAQAGVAYSKVLGYTTDMGLPDVYPDGRFQTIRVEQMNNILMDFSTGMEYQVSSRFNIFLGAEYRRMLLQVYENGNLETRNFIWSAGANLGCRMHLGK